MTEPRKYYGEPDMRLPEGKTCSDCRLFKGCKGFFGCKPDAIECDFSPSRFREAEKGV